MTEFEQARVNRDKEQHYHEDVLHKIASQLERIVLHLRWLIVIAWIVFGFVVGWHIGGLIE